jgi:NAD(P)-dependent dehydrogenase (short-subunit alcohol dehydrogenase family)
VSSDQPRTALVTGATSGIGRAIAAALAADGTVWAVGRRADELAALAREYSSVRPEPADLAVNADIERVASEVNAPGMPRTAEVTGVHVRPTVKPG